MSAFVLALCVFGDQDYALPGGLRYYSAFVFQLRTSLALIAHAGILLRGHFFDTLLLSVLNLPTNARDQVARSQMIEC
jgi:hypothetical protein